MTDSRKRKYRVAIIGCGRKGTQHARAYQLTPMTEVVAAADTDSDNLQLFCKRFKVPGYSNYREMLVKERIDIAAPILPVKPNPEVVIGCAESGVRGILCEKPIAASLADADHMVDVCRSLGVKFASGDLDRNLPDYWKAREIIDSGELGAVRSINLLSGSGMEWDIQGLSLTRLFAGDANVAWVTGWMDGDAFSDDDQGEAGYIRFTNGVEAFRRRRKNAKMGIEVACTHGVFYTSYSHLSMWKAKSGVDRPNWGSLEKVRGVFKETSQYEGSGSYDADGWRWAGNRNLASVQSIIDAIENDVEPTGSGDNGRKCLEIAIAFRESHRRNHHPVRLPLKDRSLKIIPPMSRWLNKKETMSAEAYATSIGNWKKGE